MSVESDSAPISWPSGWSIDVATSRLTSTPLLLTTLSCSRAGADVKGIYQTPSSCSGSRTSCLRRSLKLSPNQSFCLEAPVLKVEIIDMGRNCKPKHPGLSEFFYTPLSFSLSLLLPRQAFFAFANFVERLQVAASPHHTAFLLLGGVMPSSVNVCRYQALLNRRPDFPLFLTHTRRSTSRRQVQHPCH